MTEQKALTIAQQYGIQTTEEVREVLRANLGEGATVSAFDLDRVHVPGSGGQTWEMPSLDGTVPQREFSGVIVAWQEKRSFWATKYSGQGGSPPDCYSDDCITGYGTPGGDCKSCPYAQWGTATGPDGREAKGQACRTVRLLFTMLPGNVLPTVVSVPPSSLKSVSKYFLRLAQKAMPFFGVVTKFTLVKGEISSVIEFAPVATLSDADRADVQKYAASIAPLLSAVRAKSEDFGAE